MVKQIFVNLPVKNLEASKSFWIKIGFTFNPQFTNDQGASLELGENIYAMLLIPEFFSTFTKKTITDAASQIEVITAISLENRAAIDGMMTKVLAAGGQETHEAQDYGWMYSRAFQDLDGHLWELVYIDASQAPTDPSQSVDLRA